MVTVARVVAVGVLALCAGVAGSVPPEGAAGVDTKAPTVTLERAVHFPAPSGDDVRVEPGTYVIEQHEQGLRLVTAADPPRQPILLQASKSVLSEPVQAPSAVLMPDSDPDRVHLMVYLRDKEFFETMGSYSGVRSRFLGIDLTPEGVIEEATCGAICTEIEKQRNKWTTVQRQTGTTFKYFYGVPDCVSLDQNDLDCVFFSLPSPSPIMHKHWEQALTTTDLKELARVPFQSHDCVKSGDTRFHCFMVSPTAFTFSGKTPKWQYILVGLGLPPAGGPVYYLNCVFNSPNGFDCLTIDGAWRANHNSYNGFEWSGWKKLPDNSISVEAPSCVRPSTTSLRCFVLGPGHHMYEGLWDSNSKQWSNWTDHSVGLNVPIEAGPKCFSRTTNRIDCILIGSGNRPIYWRQWDGMKWSPWLRAGSDAQTRLATGAMAPVTLGWARCDTSGDSRIDCLALGDNVKLYHNQLRYDSSHPSGVWTGWLERPLKADSTLPDFGTLQTCLSWKWRRFDAGDWLTRIDCFAKSQRNEGSIYQFFYYKP